MIKMEIPQGYKHTEFGLIPNDWVLCAFKDVLTTFSSGATPYRGNSEYYTGNIRWISSGELNYNVIYDTLEHISASAVRSTNLHIHNPGTFLMAITGLEAEGTRGKCAFVGASATTNQSCLAINGSDRMCVEYLFWFYRMWGDYLAFKYCQGTKQQSYTVQIVRKLPIYCPTTIEEQKKIAEALSDVDALIVALDKKIAKKRLIKQGAMQQLLTGKKRLSGFTEKLQTVKLGTIINIYKGVQINKSQLTDSIGYDVMNGGVTPSGFYHKYNCPANTIIISEGGNSCGFVNYMTRHFWAGGHCYIVSPQIDINMAYLYMMLKASENSIMELRTGSGLPNIQKNRLLDDFELKITFCKQEQQAIATILSDMDKEIAALEARRDKYKLIKNGMMQKLLTGQIRLTKPQAKVIPLATQIPATREIPVDAHIIAGHIVCRSYQSKGWGRTKLQKSLHLIGYSLQLNLGNEYIRNTAGPDDQLLMNYIDQKFKRYRHVNIVKERLQDGRMHYAYIPTALIQEVEIAYEQYPQDVREQIDALLDKLNTMDLAGAEILSTLYAVWNNRIIKGDQITDDLLISDFYAWSAHKADFEEKRIRKALDYMRTQNIIPVGWGKYIDKK